MVYYVWTHVVSICSNYILKEYVGTENIKKCSEVPLQKHIVSMFDNWSFNVQDKPQTDKQKTGSLDRV